MAALPNPPNADLSKGFTLPQITEKHGWPAPMPVGLKKAKIILEGN